MTKMEAAAGWSKLMPPTATAPIFGLFTMIRNFLKRAVLDSYAEDYF